MDENSPLFADNPSDTKTAILKATFDALAEHGYSDLTINRISQHFPKSEGVVFYHYDRKDDVLLDLLEYLLDRFVEIGIPISKDKSPEARLRSLFDQVLPQSNEQKIQDYEIVLTELRMQAAQKKEFHDSVCNSQSALRKEIQEIIRDGIQSGDFRDTDPEPIVDFLVVLVSGEIFERVTTGSSQPIRSELNNYITHRLLKNKGCENNGKSENTC